jgi:hypothetical protein
MAIEIIEIDYTSDYTGIEFEIDPIVTVVTYKVKTVQ